MHFSWIYISIIAMAVLLYYSVVESNLQILIKEENIRNRMMMTLSADLNQHLTTESKLIGLCKEEGGRIYEKQLISQFLMDRRNDNIFHFLGYIDRMLYRLRREKGYSLWIDWKLYETSISNTTKKEILLYIIDLINNSKSSKKIQIDLISTGKGLHIRTYSGHDLLEEQTFPSVIS